MPVQIDFATIFDQLKQGIITLAQATITKYTKQAKEDGLKMLQDMEEKLERWTKMLVAGQLTTKEFEFLVNSEKDLIVMSGLKQAGLAAIRVDQFKASVLNLIVDTVFNLIKI